MRKTSSTICLQILTIPLCFLVLIYFNKTFLSCFDLSVSEGEDRYYLFCFLWSNWSLLSIRSAARALLQKSATLSSLSCPVTSVFTLSISPSGWTGASAAPKVRRSDAPPLSLEPSRATRARTGLAPSPPSMRLDASKEHRNRLMTRRRRKLLWWESLGFPFS